MEDKIQQCEQYYKFIVDNFVDRYKWKANLISFNDFLTGYSLFEIGKIMGFEDSASVLVNFLEKANVQTKTNKEEQNCQEIINILKLKKEERESKGL